MKLIFITIWIALSLTSHAFADPINISIAVGNFILASAGIATTSVAFISAVGFTSVSNAAKGIDELLNKDGEE